MPVQNSNWVTPHYPYALRLIPYTINPKPVTPNHAETQNRPQAVILHEMRCTVWGPSVIRPLYNAASTTISQDKIRSNRPPLCFIALAEEWSNLAPFRGMLCFPTAEEWSNLAPFRGMLCFPTCIRSMHVPRDSGEEIGSLRTVATIL